MTIKIDAVVEKYIAVRDEIAALKKAFEESVAEKKAQLDTLEAFILEKSIELGTDSFKTKNGTAYKKETVSATVDDWDATLEFIQANNMWNMLEHRVSKVAVEEYKAANGAVPPGVKYSSMFTIGVRRS